MENGELIRALRVKMGVKAIKLAEMLGTTRSYISQIETGRCKANDDLLNRVCKVLGINRSEIDQTVTAKNNTGTMAIGIGAKVVHGTLDKIELLGLRSEIKELKEQMNAIHALLIKLAAK